MVGFRKDDEKDMLISQITPKDWNVLIGPWNVSTGVRHDLQGHHRKGINKQE